MRSRERGLAVSEERKKEGETCRWRARARNDLEADGGGYLISERERRGGCQDPPSVPGCLSWDRRVPVGGRVDFAIPLAVPWHCPGGTKVQTGSILGGVVVGGTSGGGIEVPR